MSLDRRNVFSRHRRLLTAVAAIVVIASLWFLIDLFGRPSLTEHDHEKGTNGGIIVSVGHDHHHVEVVFTADEMRFFTLGQDQKKVVTVPVQELTAYVRVAELLESIPVAMSPSPQADDPKDQTSAFTGRLPQQLVGQQLMVVVPNLRIAEQRYRFGFQTAATSHESVMPAKVASQAEQDLYLTPGGCYSSDDIRANASKTASEKFQGFKSSHDFSPRPGDRICPVTRTKANPACSWVVRGREYQFCCPPCIDEFVKRAKSNPEGILSPEEFVHGPMK